MDNPMSRFPYRNKWQLQAKQGLWENLLYNESKLEVVQLYAIIVCNWEHVRLYPALLYSTHLYWVHDAHRTNVTTTLGSHTCSVSIRAVRQQLNHKYVSDTGRQHISDWQQPRHWFGAGQTPGREDRRGHARLCLLQRAWGHQDWGETHININTHTHSCNDRVCEVIYSFSMRHSLLYKNETNFNVLKDLITIIHICGTSYGFYH